MDEYEGLLKRFQFKIKKSFEKEIKSIRLYGSVAKGEGRYLRGESDIDLFIIIDKEADYFETLLKISPLLNEFYDDPVASSLFDVIVVQELEVPHAVNPIRLLEVKNGKIILGNDEIDSIDLTDDAIKGGSLDMACEFNKRAREIALGIGGDIGDDELYWCAESVLGVTQALLYFLGERDFTRLEAGELLQKKFGDQFNAEIAIEATRLKVGGKVDNKKDFYNKSVVFCQKTIETIIKNLPK
ncbi:MAG: nucleotidyltransferase domain-containing protein [Candidatus Wukongarchaeota archaeon]|nr:nucleotidyltransferase domain-containing protein [Candidatus Wukongarchaeota archaeon]